MSEGDQASANKGILELKAFMLERHLTWPDPPFSYVEPLGVLLDLAFNWRIGLWFDASPLVSTFDAESRHPWSLFIEPGTFVGAWAVQNEDVIHGGAYTSYWNSLRDAFSEGSPTAESDQVDVDKIAARETEILSALYKVTLSTMKKPSRFSIRDIERYTPNISETLWTREITNVIASVSGRPMLEGMASTITVSDVALIGAINRLYAKYTSRDILEHISWFFVQAFAPLADRKFLVSKYGNRAMANAHRKDYCATEVEAAYRYLVVTLYTMQRFSSEVRAAIDLQLGSVKDAALEKIAAGHPTWADNSSREFVATKVGSIKTILWPPFELLDEANLFNIFGTPTANESSFGQHWTDVFYATWGVLTDPRYAAAMKMPLNFVLPYFRYNYISNSVLVSVAALARPLYDTNGTASMTYGGLGFSYAAQLVRAFDNGGMAVHTDGNIAADSWSSASWKWGSRSKLECLKPFYDSPFPEIPALEIAHAAFRRALANDSELLRLVTPDYTEEQVFFITACFTLCTIESSTGSFYGGDCNKAAKNYAPFAEAFGCRDGAPMKPANVCSYFD
ncbi:hypothetical protein HPB48_022462 [Haemaphysalis longicornis]|uniref:Peptidase M13 N-terminal domain-containing protein n=1 Tax=Haemaphysalis longicornis TaxID=44386 RepID=A0A9J6G2R4_HAELO|nr:hypothetical protein HPB48_022462 [Haemaphysalis longicornis]